MSAAATGRYAVIDPLDGPALAIAGRIVTMDGTHKVIDDGVVYVAQGGIVGVEPRGAPPPDGFDAAKIVETGGTIFPGLIELHNHIAYNVLPLWQVPGKFTDRNRWAKLAEKRQKVTAPMAVLAGTPDLLPPVARYVECKCLFGGTTTTQGFRLNNAGGAVRYYRGLVRNVEQTQDAALPNAGGRIPDVAKSEVAAFLKTLKKSKCYFLHLSEGTDDNTRQHFRDLEQSSGWAITEALTGIHATALTADDLRILKNFRAAVVWSPLSNFLLYKDTMRIRQAHDLKLSIGIGSDWSVTGSKNLLGELKVARIVARELGAGITDEDLVAMATCDAAVILRWHDALGSLEKGKRGDLLVIRQSGGDPYATLLDAHEADVQLVLINGVPRFGTASLMTKAGFPDTESVSIGSAQRRVYLEQKTADPAVGKISFAAARNTLKDALQDLPDLAKQVDAKRRGVVAMGDPERWHIALDEMATGDFAAGVDPGAAGAFHQLAALGLGADTLESLVSPVALDPPTVANDADFLDAIDRQLNLPAYLKSGLQQAYS